MKVKFISTASVIISTEDCCIWTDPWIFGKAFNNSWALFPEIPFDENDYARITHVWVSHEHPDHFHIPTLKSLSKEFKNRVTLLFQQNHSDKMPNAFKMLGFNNIKLIENRKITSISDKTNVQVVQVGSMDSSLAVIDSDHTILNINDCEISKKDCKNFLRDLGTIDLALNQFSVAGYNGYYDYDTFGPISASIIMDNLVWNHKIIKARYTMPFASNIRFCCEDNKHINTFANTPFDVKKRFDAEGLKCLILYPGEEFDLAQNDKDPSESLGKYEKLYATISDLKCDPAESVELEHIRQAFIDFCADIRDRYPRFLYKKLSKICIKVPDLQGEIIMSVKDNIFEFYNDGIERKEDLIISSQPLHFAFNNTWGIQTLGISGRFLVLNSVSPWKWYRIISSMNNSEVYLSSKYFFSAKTIKFIRQTFRQGMSQFIHQWRVRVTGTKLDKS